MARRAGMVPAASEAHNSVSATTAKVDGSLGFTSKRKFLNTRILANAPAAPGGMPTQARKRESPRNIPSMSSVCAPSAIRTPISCVRLLMVNRRNDDRAVGKGRSRPRSAPRGQQPFLLGAFCARALSTADRLIGRTPYNNDRRHGSNLRVSSDRLTEMTYARSPKNLKMQPHGSRKKPEQRIQSGKAR